MADPVAASLSDALMQSLPLPLKEALPSPEGWKAVGDAHSAPLGQAIGLESPDKAVHRSAVLLDGPWLHECSQAGEAIPQAMAGRADEQAPLELPRVMAYGPSSTGTFWALMELAPGVWLNDQISKHGRAPLPQCLQIIRLAAQALAWWHGKKMLAGPVLPRETWAPLDGKSAQFPWLGFSGSLLAGDWFTTERGAALLPYCPPEVLDGATWDISADLYALGCLAYFLLTGEMPFPGAKAEEVRTQQRSRKPRTPPELRMGVPGALSDLVMRLISTQPHERPIKAQPVADRLISLSGPGSPATGEAFGAKTDSKGSTPVPRLVLADEEINRLKAEAEATPTEAEGWLKLGQAQLRLGKPGDATVSAELALKLNPRLGAAALLRVDAHLARGDAKRALLDLQPLVRALPNAPQVRLRLARAHFAGADATKTIAECDLVLKADARNIDALALRAQAHESQGETLRALTDMDQAVELATAQSANPVSMAKLFARRSDLHLTLGHTTEAQEDMRAAITADSSSLAARQARAKLFLELGKAADAEDDCDHLVAHAGRAPWSWLLRARQRIAVAEYRLALEDLEQAMELEASPVVLSQTALLLAAAPDKSVRDPDRALELGRKAAEETGWDDPTVLEAVAAAYAACKQCEAAAGWTLKAITKAKGADRDRLQEMLKIFKTGKPFRLGR